MFTVLNIYWQNTTLLEVKNDSGFNEITAPRYALYEYINFKSRIAWLKSIRNKNTR